VHVQEPGAEDNVWTEDTIKRQWKELHREKLHAAACSRNTIRVIRSRTIRWAGNVARMREKCIQNYSHKMCTETPTYVMMILQSTSE
jgi:hypothetical protein